MSSSMTVAPAASAPTPQPSPPGDRRRRGGGIIVLIVVALVGLGVALVVVLRGPSGPATLSPALGDRTVFYAGTGTGTRTVALATETRADGSLVPTVVGGRLAVVGTCIGRGTLSVALRPGTFRFTIACSAAPGTTASDVTTPGDVPWPTRAVVTAAAGSSWSLDVVDPTGSVGVARG